MVLAHGDDALVCRVDRQVRMAHIPFGADRPRRITWILPVHALVVEVGEPDGGAADGIVAAAIFMDASAGVEAARCDVGDRAVRGSAHDDLPSVCVRPSLAPVEVVTIPPRRGQSQLALEKQVDGDRGRPGSERRDLFQSRLMISASPWPPPPHSAAAPTFAPRRLSSSASVSTRRAPLAPIGWPSATAPPLTFTRSSSSRSMRVELIATDAKASLISTRSRSSASRPAFFSALASASAGTVCSQA